MKRSLALALASFVVVSIVLLAPVAAHAHPAGNSAHMRPALFHDRSPRPHVHVVQPHH